MAATVLAGCAASDTARSAPEGKPPPANVCALLDSDAREANGLLTAKQTESGTCVFKSDDPKGRVRISVRARRPGGLTSMALYGPVVRVSGFGRGVTWYQDTPDASD